MRQAMPTPDTARPADCLEAARRLSREFSEKAAARDLAGTIDYGPYEDLRASVLLATRVPREAGGPGCAIQEMVEIVRLLGHGDPNIAQAMLGHFMVADAVRLWGNERQRERYFADLLQGQIFGNAFAERGTKYVGEVKTRLSRDGDGYRLNGTKFYSTGALMSDQLLINATADEGPALLIVPCDRPGLRRVDDWTGMGQRTTGSGMTTLENVWIAPEEAMIIPDFARTRTFFGAFAQILHVAVDTGIAAAAVEDAIDFGRTKARPMPESGVERQVDDPYAVRTVGEMTVLVHQAEAMLQRAATFLEPAVDTQLRGKAPADELERLLCEASVAVAEAKICATEASLRVSEMLYLVGGASATLRELDYDRHWRNARTHTVHDPIAYKYKVVGDYFLGGKPPPLSTKV